MFVDMHGPNTVDGAFDNLSGVALSIEMAKVFSVEKLKHTRLRIISFGAEEACLRGSWAYARNHKQQLIQEKAFLLNIDSIKDVEHLTIGTSETNTLVFYKKEYIKMAEDAFNQVGVPVKKLALTVGASDASAFGIQGLPAICIIGMDSAKLDPAYHTRLDVIECINPKALEDTKKALVQFIRNWDRK
jgi:Zn-dependent M28 family amino/carboxypeptidase